MQKINVGADTPGGRTTRNRSAKSRRWSAGWRLKCAETKTEVLRPPRSRASSPTQIVKKRIGRLTDRNQGLDRDRLKIIVTLQSGVFLFRLLTRSCHLRHIARTLHGKIKIIIITIITLLTVFWQLMSAH